MAHILMCRCSAGNQAVTSLALESTKIQRGSHFATEVQGYIGIMEDKMETTTMGYIGLRV